MSSMWVGWNISQLVTSNIANNQQFIHCFNNCLFSENTVTWIVTLRHCLLVTELILITKIVMTQKRGKYLMIVKNKEMEENKFINKETLDCSVSRKTYDCKNNLIKACCSDFSLRLIFSSQFCCWVLELRGYEGCNMIYLVTNSVSTKL